MATTKIWPVYHDYVSVIDYAVNEEKTTIPTGDLTALNAVIDYALAGGKTQGQRLVSAVNCSPDTAYIEMMQTKERFGKLGGRTGYHGYQSFAPGEVTPEQAHALGLRLAQEAWGDQYQVVVTTHIDKAHLHNHFVINSVSYVDGKKMRDSFHDYYDVMRGTSDRICEENDLSIVENPYSKRMSYTEWRDTKGRKGTLRELVCADVDEAIANAQTMQQFIRNLKGIGYDVDTRRMHWRVRPHGRDKYIRLDGLGEMYTPDAIMQRLGEVLETASAPTRAIETPRKQNEHHRQYQQRQYRVVQLAYLKPSRRPKTLRGLYYHYLCLMRFYAKRPPNERRPFLIRAEQRKLDAYIAQMDLLRREKIDTPDQLAAFRTKTDSEIARLTKQRNAIYNKRRISQDDEERERFSREGYALTAQHLFLSPFPLRGATTLRAFLWR